ncbi:MAG TPA: DUF4870 domain-containing protein [Ktedonobacterales bacterium]
MSSGYAGALTVALRNGVVCVLSGDALTIGETTLPLRALVSATLVADTSVPVAPGMPPAPAVALRLGDGTNYYLTPVEQADAMRLLQAIQAARPDLPPPGYAPPQPGPVYGYAPPQPGPGYAPPPPGWSPYGPAEGDRTLAGICHLSVFFAPIILPLIVWLAMRQSHPYASQQAKQAFWFHLFMGVLSFIAVIVIQGIFLASFFAQIATASPSNPPSSMDFASLGVLFALYPVIIVVGLLNAIFSVIAAVKAFKGEPYYYPLLGWL